MAVKSKKAESSKVDENAGNQNQSNEPKENSNPETGKESSKNLQESTKKDSGNETLETKGGMTYEVAENEMATGAAIKLPEWEGFWFIEHETRKPFVYTKDNQILDTPNEEYKSRNDWQVAELTDEQASNMEKFWEQFNFEKKARQENAELLSKKVVKFNRTFDGKFQDFKGELTYADLIERKNIPEGAVEILLEDGLVFNVRSFKLTNKTI